MNKEIEYSNGSLFERPTYCSNLDALFGLQRAVKTLFISPSHETLHLDVANQVNKEPLHPLQPSLEQVVADLYSKISPLIDHNRICKLEWKELTQLGGILIQFTDYVPKLQLYACTPYEQVDSLYNLVVNLALETARPITLSEQLSLALSETNGDLPEALWRLFITARLHARWLDQKAISNMPINGREQIINRMIQWQNSLAGYKISVPQDIGGDNYYTWTHALAAVAFNVLPAKLSNATRLAAHTFENGTKIMHKVVHRYNPQTVVNDHSVAAAYGNAIGKACSKMLTI